MSSSRKKCEFCSGFEHLEAVYENDVAVVALHDDWAVRGHAMVVARRHVENISGLSEEEFAGFTAVYRRAERVLLELTGAERAVILKLGIAVPHLHVHIYPVAASLDRAGVMDIIEGRRHEERDPNFVRALRDRLADSSFIPHPSPL